MISEPKDFITMPRNICISGALECPSLTLGLRAKLC